MKDTFKFAQLIIFVLISFSGFTQAEFTTIIEFPENFNKNNINILYDCGVGLSKANDNFKKNKIIIKDKLNAKYATISIEYENKRTNFWVSDILANIILDFQDDQLIVKKYQNAYKLTDLGEKKMLDFIYNENNDFNVFLESNKNWRDKDTLIKIFWNKKFNIENKKLEFVKQNSNLYYSFSLFRRELIHSQINIDTLLNTYHQTFPDSFKLSTEGGEILKVLNGKNLKKNLKAPDFNLFDIKGKRVALQNLKDNYVLLTFWSTSCKPCLEEMPTILQLNNSYAQKKLTVVSVSTDTEREIFLKTIKKYQMNWINIYGNLGDIIKSYGVQSIPQIYLIDKSGKIIYSREEEEDFTPELLILRTTLKNIFLNT